MEKTIYNGKYIQATEEIIQGQVWERAYIPNGVIIFPVTDDKKILLVKEKRPHERPNVRLKTVAGILEPHESPEENANRELQEEVGFKATTLTPFFTYHSSGAVNSTQYFFLAQGLIPSKVPNPDGEDTIMEILAYSMDEIYQMLLNEEIKWSSSMLGYWKLYQLIKENKIKL